jgi:hypothetical protein
MSWFLLLMESPDKYISIFFLKEIVVPSLIRVLLASISITLKTLEKKSLFLSLFLKLGYIHYTGCGGVIVTIPIRLILYSSYTAPSSLPLNPLPIPLQAIAKGFFVLFHIGI